MEHRDKIILQKVLREIGIAQDMMCRRSLEEFKQNEMLMRALGMTVINIGELVKNLSDACRRNNRHIPWKEIAGFRDIAAHKYQTLRMDEWGSLPRKKDRPQCWKEKSSPLHHYILRFSSSPDIYSVKWKNFSLLRNLYRVNLYRNNFNENHPLLRISCSDP